MIRPEDIQILQELKSYLITHIDPNDPSQWDWIETINRLTQNLQIAEKSYRWASVDEQKKGYYTAECEKCGWWGSSVLLDGGGQIADTGDYDDPYCPVCGNKDLDEKSGCDFDLDLLEAIGSGYQTDYVFDGTDEVLTETFNKSIAKESILVVLDKHKINYPPTLF